MDKLQQLQAEINDLTKKAKGFYDQALEAENAEDRQALELQGDEAKAAADEKQAEFNRVKAIMEKQKALTVPVMPAPLPGQTNTADNMPMPSQQSPDPAQQQDADNDRIKSIYTLRYNQEDAATEVVMRDLHGADYQQLRLDQWKAFTRYLRDYSHEPDGQDQKLLKQIILTPAHAKAALNAGLDVKAMKATMIEAVDTLGGYTVPVDFQEEVIRRLRGFTVMRGRAMVSQTSRDRVELPKLTGGSDQYTTAVRVTWVSEVPTAGTADTNLTWGLESIPVNNVMAETFLSRNYVDDSAVDVVAELVAAFSEAQAIDEDNQFLTGTGVGVPQGILVGGAAPITGVTAANSGAAAALTADGLITLQYSIASQYRSNAVFILNRSSLQAIRKLKDGFGRYLFEPGNGGITERVSPTLLGDPILEQEIMPDIAAGTYPIIYGDPRGYRIVDRIGMSVERYLDSGTARTNRVLYIMNRRLGGQVTNPERFAVQLVSA